MDIKIKEIERITREDLRCSELKLNIKGKDVSYSLINTIRRLAIDHVPTYGFIDENIKIEKNTSIFNNDEMRLRIRQMTIPDIKIPIEYLEEKYWLDKEKHPEDNKIIEIYMDIKNNTLGKENGTTNNMKIYIDGEEKNTYSKKYPHLIIQLKPKQEFKMYAKASIGIGYVDNIWSAASNVYYEMINENEGELVIKSQGQMDEYEILYKCCIILKNKMKEIKNIVNKEKKEIINNKLKIILYNVDHTMTILLNDIIQNNDKVSGCATKRPNLLKDEMHIDIETFKENPLKVFNESIEKINKIMDNIKEQIMKLGKKYINYNK